MSERRVTLEQVKRKLADGSIRPWWGPKAAEMTEDERAQVIVDAINTAKPAGWPRASRPQVNVEEWLAAR